MKWEKELLLLQRMYAEACDVIRRKPKPLEPGARINAVLCHVCGDMIESTHVHDYRHCSCKNVAVDGGNEYHKRSFETGKWEDIG